MMQPACFIALFYLTIGFAAASVDVAKAGNDAGRVQRIEEALIELRATDQAWRRNDAEFRAMRKEGAAPETEIQEFAGFVAGLQRQVFEGCQAVRELGGDSRQYGIECAILAGGAGDKPASKSKPLKKATEVPTGQEEAELLAAELRQLEGGFDEMILRKQEELKQRRGSAGASGRLSGGRGGEPGEPPDAGDGAVDSGEKEPIGLSGAIQGTEVIEPGAGPGVVKSGKVSRKKAPGGAGTGNDDDIVARQLREAAESESDPVLKEQLWVEYKKYKDSTH